MKKIYISGRVTRVTSEDRAEKFMKAEEQLRNAGLDVINPIKLIEDPNTEWEEAMKKGISEMMFCDAVFALPCWKNSNGAVIEICLARRVGIPVIYSNMDLLVRLFEEKTTNEPK